MKIGYRKFNKYFNILVFMGCGYLMLNFWEEGKGQISSYNMQDKAFMIFWFMIYTFGAANGIINALTSIYIYEWGMKILFWGYGKSVRWEEFIDIQKRNNHFLFQMSKREVFLNLPYNSRFSVNLSKKRDPNLLLAVYHPFTSFVICDKTETMSANIIPLSADEFCDLLTSYGVKYTESK